MLVTALSFAFLGYGLSLVRTEEYLSFVAKLQQGEAKVVAVINERTLVGSSEIILKCSTYPLCKSAYERDESITLQISIRDSVFTKELESSLLPGDLIQASGYLTLPREPEYPSYFSLKEYADTKKINGFISAKEIRELHDDYEFAFARGIFIIRTNVAKKIDELYDEKTAGLMRGLLLGDRTHLTDEVEQQYIQTGIMHAIAVSGLHIVIIAGILHFLFRGFSPKRRIIFTLLGITLFILLSGMSASALRAGYMAVLFMLAQYNGRSTNGYNILAISGLFILLLDTHQLYEPGFQLSFAAVAILIYTSPLTKYISELRWVKLPIVQSVVSAMVITVLIQLMMMPILLYYFGMIPLASIPANIAVVPLSNVLIAVGLINTLLGFVFPWVSELIAIPINWLNAFMNWIISTTIAFDLGIISTTLFPKVAALLMGGIVIVCAITINKVKTITQRIAVAVVGVVLIIMVLAMSNNALIERSGENILVIKADKGLLLCITTGNDSLLFAGESKVLESERNQKYLFESLIPVFGFPKNVQYLELDEIQQDTPSFINTKTVNIVVSKTLPKNLNNSFLTDRPKLFIVNSISQSDTLNSAVSPLEYIVIVNKKPFESPIKSNSQLHYLSTEGAALFSVKPNQLQKRDWKSLR